MSGLTVLLAGDSTVATYPPEEYPMSGWGAHLEHHLNGLGTVRNFAKNGATTSSLRADGLWGSLLRACRPGDWVLIQFGHNDQKVPELAPYEGYTENLATMVAEVRARNATPVLCTSSASTVPRRSPRTSPAPCGRCSAWTPMHRPWDLS